MLRIAEITGLTPLLNVVVEFRYEELRATPLMGSLFTFLKYRFKEFEKDGEWVEKKLGEVCELITKGTNYKIS